MISNFSILYIIIVFLIASNFVLAQRELHVAKIEEVLFSINQFEIGGNLYLPRDNAKNALAIWVHGDGPDLRTSRFPGTPFFNAFLDNGFAYSHYDKPRYRF